MTVGFDKPSHETALGLIEVDGVPSGIRTADAVIKEAPLRILGARPITPARFVLLFEGEVEAVSRALTRAAELAGSRLVGRLFLPRPHEQLVAALGGRRHATAIDALAVVECKTVAAALASLDAALKEGEVSLLEMRLAMGLAGNAFWTITGEVSSVEASVERARSVAGDDLRDSALIPQPDRVTHGFLLEPTPPFSAWI